MTTKNQNINDLTIGDDAHLLFTVRNENTGEVIDLTAFTARWVLAEDQGGIPIFNKSSSSGDVYFPGDGRIRIELDSSETETLTTDEGYFHELELTDGQGHVSTAARGTIFTVEDTA